MGTCGNMVQHVHGGKDIIKKIGWILAIFFLVIPTVAAIQEELGVCQTNTECIIGDYVYNDSYQGYNSQGCTLNLTAPNGTKVVIGANMTNNSIDKFFHNFSFWPTSDGLYFCEMFCNFSGDVGRRNCNFVVLNLTMYNISSKISNINSTLWNIYNNTILNVYVGGNYNPNEVGRVIATLSRFGTMVTGATLNLTIYSPNGNIIENANMSSIGSGIYRYNFTVPSTRGDYIVNVTADSIAESGVFTVSTITNTIHTEHSDTQDTIKERIKNLKDMVREPSEADVFTVNLTTFLRSSALSAAVIIIIVFFIILFIVWVRSKQKPEGGTEEEVEISVV